MEGGSGLKMSKKLSTYTINWVTLFWQHYKEINQNSCSQMQETFKYSHTSKILSRSNNHPAVNSHILILLFLSIIISFSLHRFLKLLD